MKDIFSNLSPIFKGLGFINFWATVWGSTYYNMVIAYTIYYFFCLIHALPPVAVLRQ